MSLVIWMQRVFKTVIKYGIAHMIGKGSGNFYSQEGLITG